MSASDDSRARILNSIRSARSANPNLKRSVQQHSRTKYSFDANHFRTQLANAGAEILEATSLQGIPSLVAGLCQKRSLPLRLAVVADELTALDWSASDFEISHSWDESLTVALTTCAGAIAETGQLVVTDRGQDAWLSLVADIHVAVVSLDKLYSSLDDLPSILGNSPASITTLICGPSRTADIEQALVVGAHGPRELCVILLKADNCATQQ